MVKKTLFSDEQWECLRSNFAAKIDTQITIKQETQDTWKLVAKVKLLKVNCVLLC
jgi:hypothetical protein